jgi:signal transduction histidine kinase
MGVRARLVLWNVIVIAILLTGMGLALRFELKTALLAQVEKDLKDEVGGSARVQSQAHSAMPSTKNLVVQSQAQTGQFVVTKVLSDHPTTVSEVVRNNDDIVSLNAQMAAPRLIPVNGDIKNMPEMTTPLDQVGFRLAVAGKTTFRNYERSGKVFRSISEPIMSRGRIFAVAQAERDLTPISKQLHQLDVALATILPLAVVLAALSGAWLVGVAMRPLRNLIESARGLDVAIPERQLPIVGKDEFSELAVAFNEAFDRTTIAFTSQSEAMAQLERFTADAGHELRTPLGVLKGSVTFLLGSRKWTGDAKHSLEIMDRASDRMTKLIGDLLLLARHDGHRQLMAKEPLIVSRLITETLDLLPKSDQVFVEVEIEDGLAVNGDPLAVVRVLTNILANALTYARTRVSVAGSATDSGSQITIQDDGEGIAHEDLARLGERFFRPDSSRSRQQGGTGLGLAIAKSLVLAHGGTLHISSELEVGTTVNLFFPN